MAKYHQGKFTPRNPRKYIGDPNNIFYRSSWELTFMRDADSNKNVINWSSEELAIPYFYAPDGKWHRYFPDFLVSYKQNDGKVEGWCVEIKPESQTKFPKFNKKTSKKRQLVETLEYEKNIAKWTAAKKYCDDKGWKFVVMTEKNLGLTPR